MILDQYKLMAGAAALALVAGVFGWLVVSRANLKADLAAETATATVCLSANDDWKTKAEEANAAFSRMKAEADARAKTAAIAQQKATGAANAHGVRAATIMKAKPSGEACIAAHDLITTYLRGMK